MRYVWQTQEGRPPIAHGIRLGIVAWVAIHLLAGRRREVHPVLGVLAVVLVVFYALR